MLALTALLSVLSAARCTTLKQEGGVAWARVGGTVTLRCFHNSAVTMHFSWYRQIFGRAPELLSSVYKYDEKTESGFQALEKYPRFSVECANGTNHLHIADVRCSDSAFYLCGSSHSNRMEFGEGVFLTVSGAAPGPETARPGGSAAPNCTAQPSTCAGDSGVRWFKHGSSWGVLQSLADPCEASAANAANDPNGANADAPPRRCAYHFRKTNVSAQDAQAYYCAVVSCGEMLYGGKLALVDGPPGSMRVLVGLSIGRVLTVLVFVMVCHVVCARKGR